MRETICNNIKKLESIIKNDGGTLDNYIQIIFSLLLFLVDCHHSKKEHDAAHQQLSFFFQKVQEKYSENAELLFFLGYFIPIAEWYFNIDDISIAYQMRKKAMLKSPENVLYRWSYYFSDPDNEQAGILAARLLKHPNWGLDWLADKGMPGQYIIGMIEKCDHDWKQRYDPDNKELGE